MINSVIRKGRQIAADPVLRGWLLGRLLGRWPGEPASHAHRPPYLEGLLPLAPESPHTDLGAFNPASPTGPTQPTEPIELPLPGLTLKLQPGDQRDVFKRQFDDVETLLALHRFSWINSTQARSDPQWVYALWTGWLENNQQPDDTWTWHPYTAGERAINLLDFAAHHGLPGPREATIKCLADHGPAIAARLEYFGDHHTSNHLANNGRGLYLLGLALGLENCAKIGARILINEAARIFLPSGILREGSSHYHLLLALNYAQCAKAALIAKRAEADQLNQIAQRALSIVPHLILPGGLALFGDISPDSPPLELLEMFDDQNVTGGASRQQLTDDGWLRADFGPWSGLWHAAPGGWSHMPGHGHQDTGGFEVHYGDQPVFIDPGRGGYGETGEAALYRAGRVHNTLLLEGAEPFPPNKPYYDEKFRRHIGGAGPVLELDAGGVSLSHHGFARLEGGGQVFRNWVFSGNSLELRDRVEGHGRHTVTRHFCTPLQVSVDGDTVLLRRQEMALRMSGKQARFTVTPAKRWTAYGVCEPASFMTIEQSVNLPWSGDLKLEVI